MKLTEKQRGNEFWAIYELAPGEGETLHVHKNHEQCVLILSGRVVIGINELTASAPQTPYEVWVPAGVPHFFRAETDAVVVTIIDVAKHGREYLA